MKTAIIEVHDYDDVPTLQDKMLWARASRILLVWPQDRSPRWQGPLDLVLLRRHAARLGARLALVTDDPHILAWAQQARVPVFPDIETAHRRSWRARRRRRKRPRRRMRKEEFSSPGPRGTPLSARGWVRGIAFGAGVFSVLVLLAFLLPGARVALPVATREQTVTLTLRARPDGQEDTLPLQRVPVVVEGTFTRPVRGTRLWPYRAATGQVVFTNQGSEGVSIPAGLRIFSRAKPELAFEVQRAGRVPAGVGRQVTLPVLALTPGRVGNRPAHDVQVLPATWEGRVTVTNPEPLTGGLDLTVPWPRAAEYQTLRTEAQEALRAQAEAVLQDRGGPWVRSSLTLETTLDERFSPDPPEAAAQLTLHLQQRYRAWAVLPEPFAQWLTDALDARLPSGWRAQADSLSWEWTAAEPLPDGDGWRWTVTARRTMYHAPSRERVIALGRGKPIAQGAAYLQTRLDLPARPRVQPWPSFWPWLPWWEARWHVALVPQNGGDDPLEK